MLFPLCQYELIPTIYQQIELIKIKPKYNIKHAILKELVKYENYVLRKYIYILFYFYFLVWFGIIKCNRLEIIFL